MKYIFRTLIVSFLGVIALSVTSCKKNGVLPIDPGPDSLKVGLIAYYPFNNSTADSSGNGNTAVNNNATLTTNRFNVANTAYSFNGTSSYMVVADNTALRLASGDFSINVWINLAAYNLSYGTEILVKRNAGVAQGWNYGITGVANLNNNLPYGVTSFQLSGGSDPLATGNKQISLNQWHMLTTVYYAKQKMMIYYVDGLPDDVTYNIAAPNANISANMAIGQDSQTTINTNYFLKGKLDDIRIYNRALSVTSIQKLYNLTY